MKRSIIKRDNCTISFIKSSKFKNCSVMVLFKRKLNKEEITVNNLLVDCLTYSCKKYPTKNLLQKELERLYDANIEGVFYKTGKDFFQRFYLSFLNPKYCDKGYVKEVFNLLMEIIFNPNIKDNKFDEDTFNISKKFYLDTLTAYKEEALYVAGLECLKLFAPDTMTGYIEDGNIEDLEKIKNEDVVKAYNEMMSNSDCNIYIVGNCDSEEFLPVIDNYFVSYTNKKITNDLYVNNKERQEVLNASKSGPFKQDVLMIYYNVKPTSKRDRFVVLSVFNKIFSTGGLNSKLYKRVREENSLCYTIVATRYSYDNCLSVYAGINKKDKDKCLVLIDQCLNEMVNGDFTDKDVKDAIKALEINIKGRRNTSFGVMSEYISIDNYDGYEDEEFLRLLKGVTKSDVMRVAKLIKKNLTFLLYGEEENAKD